MRGDVDEARRLLPVEGPGEPVDVAAARGCCASHSGDWRRAQALWRPLVAELRAAAQALQNDEGDALRAYDELGPVTCVVVEACAAHELDEDFAAALLDAAARLHSARAGLPDRLMAVRCGVCGLLLLEMSGAPLDARRGSSLAATPRRASSGGPSSGRGSDNSCRPLLDARRGSAVETHRTTGA